MNSYYDTVLFNLLQFEKLLTCCYTMGDAWIVLT